MNTSVHLVQPQGINGQEVQGLLSNLASHLTLCTHLGIISNPSE